MINWTETGMVAAKLLKEVIDRIHFRLSIIASEQMKKDIFPGENRVVMVYTSHD
jgi:hypothetical protein